LSRAPVRRVAIDWQVVLLQLRRHYGPLERVAKEVGADGRTLQRIARGETAEPRFTVGLLLLDLHYDHVPEETRRRVYVGQALSQSYT
jgi:hypothetical protein